MLPGFPGMAKAALPPKLMERAVGTFPTSTTLYDEDGIAYSNPNRVAGNTYAVLSGKSATPGEMVLVWMSITSSANIQITGWTAGWTKAAEFSNSTGNFAVFWRIASATTVSLNVTFGSSVDGCRLSWQAIRMFGADQLAVSAMATYGDTSVDPNPVTLSSPRNALWMVLFSAVGTSGWTLPATAYQDWLFSPQSYGTPYGSPVGSVYKVAFKASDDPGVIGRGDGGVYEKFAFTIATWKG